MYLDKVAYDLFDRFNAVGRYMEKSVRLYFNGNNGTFELPAYFVHDPFGGIPQIHCIGCNYDTVEQAEIDHIINILFAELPFLRAACFYKA